MAQGEPVSASLCLLKFKRPQRSREERRIHAETGKPAVQGRLKTVSLPITGMSCASAKIEEGIAGLSGIVTANVNFAAEKIPVTPWVHLATS
jgi:hypothetical protein